MVLRYAHLDSARRRTWRCYAASTSCFNYTIYYVFAFMNIHLSFATPVGGADRCKTRRWTAIDSSHGAASLAVSDSGMQPVCTGMHNLEKCSDDGDDDGDDVNRVSGSSLNAQRVSPDLNPRELRFGDILLCPPELDLRTESIPPFC